MPSTRPRPSDRPGHKMSKESMRTAIIVGVIIGVLSIICLVIFLWSRRIKRNAKMGTRSNESSAVHYGIDQVLQRQDKGLEIGVIQEPLPVYHTEPMQDERRLAMTAISGWERRDDMSRPQPSR